MSITSFGEKFGAAVASTKGAEDRKNLPKAQFWLNIGYQTTVEIDGVPEVRFISLPQGIPLDTMTLVDAKSNNELFRMLRSAQNDLHEQLMAKAATMQPGDEVILGEETEGLMIQLRRVKEEAAPIASDKNPLFKKLAL